MNVNFTIELFGETICHSIDIDDYDLENLSEDEKHDYILERIQNEINHNMQIYVDEDIK